MLIVIFSLDGLAAAVRFALGHGCYLPVIVLAMSRWPSSSPGLTQQHRRSGDQDYVRTARSKAAARAHCGSRAMQCDLLLPIITVVGFRIAFLLSGTIIVETVFALPGIGRLFTDSVFRLDYQVVQSLVVVLAVLVVVVNLLTDLVYAVVDPRIRI
ncbi:MAG: ABC transporter permease subunit [Caldilineaceae bacterium]